MVFLILSKKPTGEQLVDFHLSLPMEYVDSAPFLCMPKETITDIVNASMGDLHRYLPHSLEVLADATAIAEQEPKRDDNRQWTRTSPKLLVHAVAQVDVYLDGFISTCQGGPTEICQMSSVRSRSLRRI